MNNFMNKWKMLLDPVCVGYTKIRELRKKWLIKSALGSKLAYLLMDVVMKGEYDSIITTEMYLKQANKYGGNTYEDLYM